jgi:hypothetical protein
MGYLTDTKAYGGAFTVWPGSPRRVFEWAYSSDIDLGEKWRTAGSTDAPNIPLNDPIPVTARAGDVVICHYLYGARSFSQSRQSRSGWTTRVAEGHIGLRAQSWRTPIRLDAIGLEFKNR